MSIELKEIFFPKITRLFLIRLGIVIVCAYLFFSYLCIPLYINGGSMEPTYGRRGFNFCWRPSYWFSSPKRQGIVIVRFAGKKVMLLKRLVAFEDETVEFRDGKLLVNGVLVNEPYVRYPCDWNLPPRKVEKGNIYVVGDNRSMPIAGHEFGQTSLVRVMGAPLW